MPFLQFNNVSEYVKSSLESAKAKKKKESESKSVAEVFSSNQIADDKGASSGVSIGSGSVGSVFDDPAPMTGNEEATLIPGQTTAPIAPPTAIPIQAPTTMPASTPPPSNAPTGGQGVLAANYAVPVEQRADATKDNLMGELAETQTYIDGLKDEMKNKAIELENIIAQKEDDYSELSREMAEKKKTEIAAAYDRLAKEMAKAKQELLQLATEKKNTLDAISGRSKDRQASLILNDLKARGINVSNPRAIIAISGRIDNEYNEQLLNIQTKYQEAQNDIISEFTESFRQISESKIRTEEEYFDDLEEIERLAKEADISKITNTAKAEADRTQSDIDFAQREVDRLETQVKEYRAGWETMTTDAKVNAIINLLKTNDPEMKLTGDEMVKLNIAIRSSGDITEAVQKFYDRLPMDSSLNPEKASMTFQSILGSKTEQANDRIAASQTSVRVLDPATGQIKVVSLSKDAAEQEKEELRNKGMVVLGEDAVQRDTPFNVIFYKNGKKNHH
jgi:hypothetical protein